MFQNKVAGWASLLYHRNAVDEQCSALDSTAVVLDIDGHGSCRIIGLDAVRYPEIDLRTCDIGYQMPDEELVLSTIL
jgi:hypothetical protein